MTDSNLVPEVLVDAVLDATLVELGGELLDGSGFEAELPVDLDAEAPEEDAQ